MGVMRAVAEKKLCSSVGSSGIFRKISMFLLIGVAHILDTYLIGAGDVLRNTVIFFYIANEGISILENAAALDLPIPDRLKEALVNFRKKE